MNPDREQAIKDVAKTTGHTTQWLEFEMEQPFQTVPRLAAYAVAQRERVIELERDNAAQAERVIQLERALREAREFIVLVSCDEGLTYEKLIEQIDAALEGK